MEKENYQNAISLPEESGLIIEKIIEKYGIEERQEKEIEKFFESQIPEERKEIFENLPASRLAKLVKECTAGKISLEDLSDYIKRGLNTSDAEAKQITNDLKKQIFSQAELIGKRARIIHPENQEAQNESPVMGDPEIEGPEKKDSYRELIE